LNSHFPFWGSEAGFLFKNQRELSIHPKFDLWVGFIVSL